MTRTSLCGAIVQIDTSGWRTRWRMDAHGTAVYQIRFTGRLDDDGAEWCAALPVTHDEHGETPRCGAVGDQAALVSQP
jgi:hypothetical protein